MLASVTSPRQEAVVADRSGRTHVDLIWSSHDGQRFLVAPLSWARRCLTKSDTRVA
jgi:hypothetical protein